jgi:acetyltransferase-like isoleucine patch superfamily enzyme
VVGPGAVLGAVRLESSKKQSLISRELGVVLGDCAAVGANSILKPGAVLGAGVILGDGLVEEGLVSGKTVIRRQQRENPDRYGYGRTGLVKHHRKATT